MGRWGDAEGGYCAVGGVRFGGGLPRLGLGAVLGDGVRWEGRLFAAAAVC